MSNASISFPAPDRPEISSQPAELFRFGHFVAAVLPVQLALRRPGVRELSGEAVKLDVRGTPLWVAGVPTDSALAGLYRVGGTWLHVNRGIGLPRVRFGSRPEVTVIDVSPAK